MKRIIFEFDVWDEPVIGVVIPNGITRNGVTPKADGKIIRTNWSLDGGRIVGPHVRVVGMRADVLLALCVPCYAGMSAQLEDGAPLESGPTGRGGNYLISRYSRGDASSVKPCVMHLTPHGW